MLRKIYNDEGKFEYWEHYCHQDNVYITSSPKVNGGHWMVGDEPQDDYHAKEVGFCPYCGVELKTPVCVECVAKDEEISTLKGIVNSEIDKVVNTSKT